jgi:hypothetical protein
MKMKRICVFLFVVLLLLLCTVPCYADLVIPTPKYDLGPFRFFNSFALDDYIDEFAIEFPESVYQKYSEKEYKKAIAESRKIAAEYPTYESWEENAPGYVRTSYYAFNKNMNQNIIWGITYGIVIVFWIFILCLTIRRIKSNKEEYESNYNNYNYYNMELNEHTQNQYFNDED